MDKSIETIWKTGFITETLEIPKIEKLYHQKSISTVEKIIAGFKREVLMLIPMAGTLFVINILLDNENALFWGAISASPCLIWFYLGLRQLKSIVKIDYKANCYQYLKAVRKRLNNIREFNKRLAISSVPIFLFPMLIYTYYKQQGKTIGEIFDVPGMDLPTGAIFLLLPILTLIAFMIATLLFKRFAVKENATINTIISEMEILSK